MIDMTDADDPGAADLSGGVDERIAQLAALEESGEPLTEEWLRRQLHSALAGWVEDETEVDIEVETRTDY